jgi:hypothetical protein
MISLPDEDVHGKDLKELLLLWSGILDIGGVEGSWQDV